MNGPNLYAHCGAGRAPIFSGSRGYAPDLNRCFNDAIRTINLETVSSLKIITIKSGVRSQKRHIALSRLKTISVQKNACVNDCRASLDFIRIKVHGEATETKNVDFPEEPTINKRSAAVKADLRDRTTAYC